MTGVIVNGETKSLAAADLLAALAELEIDAARRGVAVALNGQLVPRLSWSEVRLAEGDRLEIVRPVAGG